MIVNRYAQRKPGKLEGRMRPIVDREKDPRTLIKSGSGSGAGGPGRTGPSPASSQSGNAGVAKVPGVTVSKAMTGANAVGGAGGRASGDPKAAAKAAAAAAKAAAQAKAGITSGSGAGDEDLSGLAAMRAEQEREKQATRDDLAAAKAKALDAVQARAGLGGLGLSGATAALTGDVGRLQDRTAVQAMGDLRKQQGAEEWTEMQRMAALWDLEEAMGVDIDGDGSKGHPDAIDDEEEGDPSEASRFSDPIQGGIEGLYEGAADAVNSIARFFGVDEDVINVVYDIDEVPDGASVIPPAIIGALGAFSYTVFFHNGQFYLVGKER